MSYMSWSNVMKLDFLAYHVMYVCSPMLVFFVALLCLLFIFISVYIYAIHVFALCFHK